MLCFLLFDLGEEKRANWKKWKVEGKKYKVEIEKRER